MFLDEFVLFFFLFGTQKLREEEEQNESEIDRVVVVGPTRGRIGSEHEREFKTKKEERENKKCSRNDRVGGVCDLCVLRPKPSSSL